MSYDPKAVAELITACEAANKWIAEAKPLLERGGEFERKSVTQDATIARLTAENAELREDKARLDWLLDFITQHGGDGIANGITWTVVEEDDGDAMLDRADVAFDRAAIDAAMKTK